MKERPILFSGPMVRAILAGTKTQTRRVVKPQPAWVAEPHIPFRTMDANPRGIIKCPYGQPGGRLWVKETHITKPSGTIYRADFDDVEAAGQGGLYGGWRPSIFCRRIDSRITLEITGVRVERLNEISEEDARAEGADSRLVSDYIPKERCGDYRFYFEKLWESINGAESWKANPWCWVISFRKLEGGAG